LSQPFLSIIVPAYNEEVRIADTLEQIAEFLNTQDYPWELLVADDGSTDGTAALVRQYAAQNPQIRLLSLEHRGKGWAVRHGVLASAGEYRFICDADLSMPIEQMARFLPPQIEGVDIIIGSREMANSRRIGEPARRHLMGRFYNRLIQLLAVQGIKDTQCGFKCFRGAIAAPLFQRQTLEGFAFDVELLFLARRTGLSIREIGIDWRYRGHSKVRAFQDSLIMSWDLLKIRWRHRGV
jgi:glycosyltransferase involved in cell wall biosynthesis